MGILNKGSLIKKEFIHGLMVEAIKGNITWERKKGSEDIDITMVELMRESGIMGNNTEMEN